MDFHHEKSENHKSIFVSPINKQLEVFDFEVDPYVLDLRFLDKRKTSSRTFAEE